MPKLYFAQMDALNDCLVIENLANVGDCDGGDDGGDAGDAGDDGHGGVGGGSLPCH